MLAGNSTDFPRSRKSRSRLISEENSNADKDATRQGAKVSVLAAYYWNHSQAPDQQG
jgi:hypothetical protein